MGEENGTERRLAFGATVSRRRLIRGLRALRRACGKGASVSLVGDSERLLILSQGEGRGLRLELDSPTGSWEPCACEAGVLLRVLGEMEAEQIEIFPRERLVLGDDGALDGMIVEVALAPVLSEASYDCGEPVRPGEGVSFSEEDWDALDWVACACSRDCASPHLGVVYVERGRARASDTYAIHSAPAGSLAGSVRLPGALLRDLRRWLRSGFLAVERDGRVVVTAGPMTVTDCLPDPAPKVPDQMDRLLNLSSANPVWRTRVEDAWRLFQLARVADALEAPADWYVEAHVILGPEGARAEMSGRVRAYDPRLPAFPAPEWRLRANYLARALSGLAEDVDFYGSEDPLEAVRLTDGERSALVMPVMAAG